MAIDEKNQRKIHQPQDSKDTRTAPQTQNNNDKKKKPKDNTKKKQQLKNEFDINNSSIDTLIHYKLKKTMWCT